MSVTAINEKVRKAMNWADTEAKEARAARGERFERIWREEGFEEVTQTWERQLADALVDAKPGEETERLKTAIKMGRKFKDWFKGVMQSGKIARKELEEIKGGRRLFF